MFLTLGMQWGVAGGRCSTVDEQLDAAMISGTELHSLPIPCFHFSSTSFAGVESTFRIGFQRPAAGPPGPAAHMLLQRNREKCLTPKMRDRNHELKFRADCDDGPVAIGAGNSRGR